MRKIYLVGLIVVVVVAGLAVFLILHKSKEAKKYTVNETTVVADSTDELWYKNSVIYTLDVEVFKDSDGDGTGDFNGLTSKLGYIDSMGANVIWIAPFQPTPNKDDGYDITDFYSIDPRLGTLSDFDRFIQAANAKKIKVIMDLVANHTSDQHPWFQQARANPNSPYRSWYVWNKSKPDNHDVGMVFPGVQKEIWTYDNTAKEYYYHRFYKFQPDLNTENPAVPAEMEKVMKFWIERGLSGFRLDAVPFYIEKVETKGEKFDHDFALLHRMRSYLNKLKKDAVILGEANVTPDENKDFFGEKGEGLHMMFNFFVNQHLFYALATGDTKPLEDAMHQTAKIPGSSQWGQFLRNHDEVDLGRLSKKDREKVYEKMGPAKSMQLYDRGIRRRLAPMLGNNRKQLELAYSFLFSLQSTPVMRYGDEIGMGDDLKLQERLAVRTPMQWTATRNAGFTTGTQPVRPVVNDAVFGYPKVNVATQQTDSRSLLNWTRQMIRLRKQHPEIAFGKWKLIQTKSKHVIGIYYDWNGKRLLTLHNFSDAPSEASLPEEITAKKLSDAFSSESVPTQETVPLPAFGYKWYVVQ